MSDQFGTTAVRRTTTALMAAALVFSGLASAAPVTMMFEGLAPPGMSASPPSPYSEAGFTLTYNPGIIGIFDVAQVGINSNGTDILGWCAYGTGYCTVPTVTLARAGGGAFSFLSFDTAVMEVGFISNVIDVIGHLSGGGTLTTTVTITDVWTTHLSAFGSVTSVDFVYGPGHNNYTNQALDNLRMDVPEPASLALLSLGLLGLGFSRRKKA